jgi:hypothetical protein
MKLRKNNWHGIALGLLILLVGGTLLIVATSELAAPPTAAGPAFGSRYSNAAVSNPSSAAALAAMEQLTSPGTILNPKSLQVSLGTSNLPSQDPITKYLRALSNVSSNLQQMQSGLQAAQTSLASGNTPSTTVQVNHLLALRNQTGTLINTLYTLLAQVQSQHNVDPSQVQDIRQRIGELQRLYVEDSLEIDQLNVEITPRTVLLNIALSNSTVLVDTALQVDGNLQTHNGTVLSQRNVTITWGSNATTVPTGSNGQFIDTIIFPPGYSSGLTFVQVSFQPTGPDATQYIPTKISTVVQVIYPPTQIKSEIFPHSALPLDSVSVSGNLTTLAGQPLENRNLQIQLDNSPIGNASSDINGNFLFTFQVPGTTANGKHTLRILFEPGSEILAPSNSTLSLAVQREVTKIQTASAIANVLSGMSLTLRGVVAFNNSATNSQGTLSGTATALLDGIPVANSKIADDGAFSLTVSIPFTGSFGMHSVELVYSADDPRVNTAMEIIPIHVYNTPIIIAISAALASGIFVVRRRGRRGGRLTTELIGEVAREPGMPIEEALLSTTPFQTIPLDWEDTLKAIDAEKNASKKIIMCYRVARSFVSNQLNERRKESETHMEFYRHVVEPRPWTEDDLRGLVDLFELAEYSPYEIVPSEGNQAENRLKKIHDGKWT